MPIDIDWDTEGILPEESVIYWKFEGAWDWEMFAHADKSAYEMALSKNPRTVHSIVDMRAGGNIPARGALHYFNRSIQKAPPNRGKVAILGASPMIRALERILRSMNMRMSAKYEICDTLEEAYELLLQYEAQHR